MTEPTSPIFLFEDFDLFVHPDTKHAERFHEPVDVAEGKQDGFDALGRRLEITTNGRDTKVVLAEEEPRSAAELERRLREYLVGQGVSAATADCDLPCLVEEARKRFELA